VPAELQVRRVRRQPQRAGPAHRLNSGPPQLAHRLRAEGAQRNGLGLGADLKDLFEVEQVLL
jgi:hypothetical protein